MKKIILINALIWAALLLSTAILFKGHANVEYSFSDALDGNRNAESCETFCNGCNQNPSLKSS